MFASAVLIAVFTSKISLNRSEQVVLDFVARINRARAYRQKTMEIIQYSVRAWFLKRNGHHYRLTFNSLYRLHTAIRQARVIKQEQKNSTNGNESLMAILSDVHDQQKNYEKSIGKIKQNIDLLDEKIKKLDYKLDNIIQILTHTQTQRQHSWL
jgi:peptidoglycan hydrolase CwlO-like protein